MSEINEPKKGNANNDISVATDAIVSKILLKSTSGNISLFTLDKGQQISEHTAPFDVLIMTVEGEVEFSVNGIPYQLKEMDYLYVPANAPHALFATKPAKVIISMYKEIVQ